MYQPKKHDLFVKLQSVKFQIFGKWQVIFRFLYFVYLRFFKDKLTLTASALTFTTLLAMVPLLSVSFAIIGAFPAFSHMEEGFRHFIFANLVPSSGATLESHFNSFLGATTKLSLTGGLALVVTSLLTMQTIENAFNSIWRVKSSRSGISAIMLYWAVLTMAPMLIGVSLAVSSYLASLPFITETASTLGVQNKLLALSSFSLELIAFVLLYVAVPNCRVKFRFALVGGVFAAVAFEASKALFSWYIQTFPTYEFLYGALATIPIFMFWVYLSWCIILLGAEIVNALSYDHHGFAEHAEHRLVVAFYWLGYLWQAQKQGEGLRLDTLLRLQGKESNIEPEEIIYYLTQAKYITQVESGELILTRDLNNTTLQNLYTDLPWKLPSIEELKTSKDTFWSKSLLEYFSKVHNEIDKQLNINLSDAYLLEDEQKLINLLKKYK